jgi:hypothetical protein
MAIFGRPKINIEAPQEPQVPIPAEEVNPGSTAPPIKFIPAKYREPQMQTPADALTDSIATLQNIKREREELDATVQDLSVELRATVAVLDQLRLEVAQLKNELSIAIRAEHEAYRECDRVRKDLEIVRGVVYPYETAPMPRSARSRKAPKNGEPKSDAADLSKQVDQSNHHARQDEEIQAGQENSVSEPTERD